MSVGKLTLLQKKYIASAFFFSKIIKYDLRKNKDLAQLVTVRTTFELSKFLSR